MGQLLPSTVEVCDVIMSSPALETSDLTARFSHRHPNTQTGLLKLSMDLDSVWRWIKHVFSSAPTQVVVLQQQTEKEPHSGWENQIFDSNRLKCINLIRTWRAAINCNSYVPFILFIYLTVFLPNFWVTHSEFVLLFLGNNTKHRLYVTFLPTHSYKQYHDETLYLHHRFSL